MEGRDGLSLLFLLTLMTLNGVWGGDRPCEKYTTDQDLSLCIRLENYDNRSEEYKILSSEGIMGVKYSVYLPNVDYVKALVTYDEPLYPIPVGSSVYFVFSITLIICWYFTTVGRIVLRNVKTKLLLHPETGKFPNLPLYWLQQGRRELSLKREVRHTWAWMARRYLMSPDDPMLHDVDEVMGLITWKDFAVPRDTWSFLNIILKSNQLYVDVKKGPNGGEVLEVKKDTDFTHLNPFAYVPESYIPTDLAQRYAELDDDEDEDEEGSEDGENSQQKKDNLKRKRSVPRKPRIGSGKVDEKKTSGPFKSESDTPSFSERVKPEPAAADLPEREPEIVHEKVLPSIAVQKPSVAQMVDPNLPNIILTHEEDGEIAFQLEYLPDADKNQMYEIEMVNTDEGTVEFYLKKIEDKRKKVEQGGNSPNTEGNNGKHNFLEVKNQIKKKVKKKKKNKSKKKKKKSKKRDKSVED